MYSPVERDAVRESLVAAARDDARITGAALTGSAARDAADEWSDVDLAFAVAAGADGDRLVGDWTERMYRDHGAVHHTDVLAGRARFRVFLLRNTLQVDLAFWPEDEFGAIGASFRLLFGRPNEPPRSAPPSFEALVGMAWLHALHARSSVARGRAWQAEYMISGVRDHVLALACLRHGVPAVQGRGMDALPSELRELLEGALVRSLEAPELRRALHVACEALLVEIAAVDPPLASRLAAPIAELSAPPFRR